MAKPINAVSKQEIGRGIREAVTQLNVSGDQNQWVHLEYTHCGFPIRLSVFIRQHLKTQGLVYTIANIQAANDSTHLTQMEVVEKAGQLRCILNTLSGFRPHAIRIENLMNRGIRNTLLAEGWGEIDAHNTPRYDDQWYNERGVHNLCSPVTLELEIQEI